MFIKSIKTTSAKTFRFLLNRFDCPAIILLYHRVINLKNDPHLLAVSPDNFSKHVKFLQEGYNLLSIDDFVRILKSQKSFPKKSVILTFDDGYGDNFTEALPILESFKAQALFYISTSNIDSKQIFWWDELAEIFLLNNKLPNNLEFSVNNKKFIFKTDTEHTLMQTHNSLHPILKNLNSTTRQKLLDILHQWSGLKDLNDSSHRVLNKNEIIKMSQSKSVVLGAHTHTHTKLSVLNYDEQYQDIINSKKILEKIAGQPIKHFSYPFGDRGDYNHDSLKIVQQLKFEMICANYYGQVHRFSNIYNLPRVIVRNWDITQFKQQINQYFTY